MKSLKNTAHYGDVLHEINYSFGNYYLFENFVIAEMHEGIIANWEQHGKQIINDINQFYTKNGDCTENIVYISNRINSYSVKPADWLKFYNNNHSMKAYGIVSYNDTGFFNALLERLFIKSAFNRFGSLERAIDWAKTLSMTKALAS